MKNKTQKEVVLEHLKNHKTITAWEAIVKYHITDLAGVIRNLKKDGNVITSKRVSVRTKEFGVANISEYCLEQAYEC